MSAIHPAVVTDVADDVVIPFSIEGIDVRGRVVRLGALITDIIARHDYPASVSLLIGEAVALTALLGTSLKFDGRFILQASTDGPVDLLVADFATPGAIRAYAHFDGERVGEAAGAGPGGLLGNGSLAMTVDQGPHMERYQGIVPLEGGSLTDAAHVYFHQSEQIPTSIHLGAGELSLRAARGRSLSWRAGGIMIQHLPPEGGTGGRGGDNGWDRARLILDTVSYDELLDPMLAPERLLYRLYHEDGVRASPARPLERGCRCSRERIRNLLFSFPPDEISGMTEDGRIKVTCEFCGNVYDFDPADFAN